MDKITIENKTNLIVLIFALLLSSCTGNKSILKSFTTCQGDVFCHNLEYKFNGNTFMYRYTLISGYKNVIHGRRELYKIIMAGKDNPLTPEVVSYYLDAWDDGGTSQLISILKKQKTAYIFFQDEDNFTLLQKDTRPCWNNHFVTMTHENSIYGLQCEHSFVVSSEIKKKVKENIALKSVSKLVNSFDLYLNN